mmetsp:Transcript_17344/g.55464  ORF Transcript_17344/g.55464 Transcript_17344/m.55464 type:complete len:331 (-) Transcript_17344:8-1000(-)
MLSCIVQLPPSRDAETRSPKSSEAASRAGTSTRGCDQRISSAIRPPTPHTSMTSGMGDSISSTTLATTFSNTAGASPSRRAISESTSDNPAAPPARCPCGGASCAGRASETVGATRPSGLPSRRSAIRAVPSGGSISDWRRSRSLSTAPTHAAASAALEARSVSCRIPVAWIIISLGELVLGRTLSTAERARHLAAAWGVEWCAMTSADGVRTMKRFCHPASPWERFCSQPLRIVSPSERDAAAAAPASCVAARTLLGEARSAESPPWLPARALPRAVISCSRIPRAKVLALGSVAGGTDLRERPADISDRRSWESERRRSRDMCVGSAE